MAEGKKKIIFYTNWCDTFKKLSDEEAGRLIKHFCEYVTDQDPEPPDRITDLLFDPIKDTLKRDLEKWKERQNVNKINGSKGGRPRKAKESEGNQKKPNGLNQNQKKGVTDTVIVIDTVKDTVIDNDILLEKETKAFNFKQELIDYGFDKDLVSDWLKVRSKKKATNSKTALNGFIKQVEKTGKDKNEVLTMCVENSWKGFNAEWIKENNNGNQFRQPIKRGAQSTMQQREDYD